MCTYSGSEAVDEDEEEEEDEDNASEDASESSAEDVRPKVGVVVSFLLSFSGLFSLTATKVEFCLICLDGTLFLFKALVTLYT